MRLTKRFLLTQLVVLRAFRGKLPHNSLRVGKHAIFVHLLVTNIVDDMATALGASASLLTVLITCLALGSADASGKHMKQPMFTSVPARVAAKGQGTFCLPDRRPAT